MNKTDTAAKVYLRKVGLKATLARLRVLEVLRQARDPVSAQTLIETLGKEIDQATIYRIVKSFKAKGIIQQIDLRHNHAHYELFKDSEHHHLVCVRCGCIEDVGKCGVEETYARVLKHAKGFAAVKEHALEFYGVCKSCAKNNEK